MKGTTGQCLADLVVQEGGTMEALAAFVIANPGLPLVTLPLAGLNINIPTVTAGIPAATVAALRGSTVVVATWDVPPGIGAAAIAINFMVG